MFNYSKFLILTVLTFCSTSFAGSQNPEDQDPEAYCINNAKRLLLENDQTVNNGITFNNCLKASGGNNPLVWFFTGYMKLRGIGASPDYEEGIGFITKAAEGGLSIAQKELSDYYLTGNGINKKIDVAMAAKWLKILANGSHPQLKDEAAFKLCALNLYGTGIPVNYDEAFFWCRKSGLDNHNTDGLTNLAYMYINGFGTDKNIPIAIDYYKTAANKGSTSAQISLGRAYSTGKDLDLNYEEAFYWMSKAAEKQNPLAIYYLAQMYEYGNGVEKDPAKAFELYSKSAELGDNLAQYTLGRWYQFSAEPNPDMAAKWYHKSAKQNNTNAMIAIAEMYREQNSKEMILWFNRAAEAGNLQGNRQLLQIYLNGTKETSAKPDLAFEQAKILEKAGDPEGIYWLSYLYLYGIGTSKDPAKAEEILQPLIAEGDPLAKKGFAQIKKEKNDLNGAISELQDAAELGCLYNSCTDLAQIYSKQNNWSETFFWLLAGDRLENSLSEKNIKLMKHAENNIASEKQHEIKERLEKWLEFKQ